MDKTQKIKETIRQINGALAVVEDKKGIITFTNLSGSLGQRTIVANLAIMYGRANMKVLVVDTDFEQNAFLETFHINNSLGLSDYLNNAKIEMSEIVNEVPQLNMSVICSGSLDLEDTHYMLNDPRFKLLIDNSVEKYDLILINATMLQKYDEFKNICSLSDGVAIVTDPENTRKKTLFNIFKRLRNDKVRILGYIIAKRPKK